MKKNIKQPGLIVQERKPDSDKSSEDMGNSAMEAAAQDILRAIDQKDHKHLALALQAAYDICEAGERPSDDESYASQNAKAAQEER